MFSGTRSRRFRSIQSIHGQKRLLAAIEALESRRLLSAGMLDPTFANHGIATTTVTGPIDSNVITAVQDGSNQLLVESLADKDLLVARYTNGTLDTSFGTNGYYRTDIGPGFDLYQLAGMALAPDGDIVLMGMDDSAKTDVVELTANGQLDPTFNGTGELSFDFTGGNGDVAELNQIAVDSENRIVLSGFEENTDPSSPNYQESDFAVVRLNPDGALDSTFNALGALPSQTGGTLPGTPGQEVVSEGTGLVSSSTLSIGTGNQIILAGNYIDTTADNIFNVIAWLNPDGSLDTNFNTTGEKTEFLLPGQEAAQPLYTAVNSQDQLLMAANEIGGIVLARFDSSGIYDPNFGAGGSEVLNFAPDTDATVNSVAVSGDGEIAVGASININPYASYNFDLGVAVLNGDGTLDAGFNPVPANSTYNSDGLPGGEASVYLGNVAQSSDDWVGFDSAGDVTLAGSENFDSNYSLNQIALIQFDGAGALNTTFNNSGTLITAMTSTQDANRSSTLGTDLPLIAQEPDGDIVEAFTTDDFISADQNDALYLVQFNPDGSLNTNFGNGGFAQVNEPGFTLTGMAIAPAGDIYLTGGVAPSFNALTSNFALVSYQSNGTINSSFGNDGFINFNPNPSVNAISYATGVAIAPSGNIVVTGLTPAPVSGHPDDYIVNTDVAEFTPTGSNPVFNSLLGPIGLGPNQATVPGGISSPEVLIDDGEFEGSAIAVDSSGNIDVAGLTGGVSDPNQSQINMTVVQLTAAGAINTAGFNAVASGTLSFAPGLTGGVAEIGFGPNYGDAFVTSEAVDSAGDIIVGGWVEDNGSGVPDLAVGELTSGGAPDSSLNSTGENGIPAGSDAIALGNSESGAVGVAVDSNGDLFVAGNSINIYGSNIYYNANIVEFTNGELNSSFGSGGVVTTAFGNSPDNFASGLVIDSQNRAVLSGETYVYGGGDEAVAVRYLTQPVTTGVSSGLIRAVYGQSSVNLTASVTATDMTVDTGSVTFTVTDSDNNLIATLPATFSDGTASATLSLAGLNAGTYTIQASYTDGSDTFASGSGSSALDISQATPTVTATAAGIPYNGSAYPNSDVTPTVTGLGGSVTLTDGSFSYAYYDSSNNLLTSAPTAAGTYSVVVTWSGDTNFTTASSAAVPFMIGQATPTVTAIASDTTYNGLPYPNADVTPTVTGLGGSVTLTDGSFTYAYYDSSDNLLSSAPTGAGSYSVVVTWSGDTNFASASSAAVPFTIGQATPIVTASASGTTYNALPYPNSNVSVDINGSPMSDGTITSYTYFDSSNNQLSGPPTDAGNYSVVVTWSGDGNYVSASSAPAPFTIAQATPTVTASAASVPFDAMPYPSSDVTVSVTGVNNVAIAGGSDSFIYYDSDGNQLAGPPTAPGSYSVAAVWSGDLDYSSATSSKAPFTINPVVNNTAMVTASAQTVTYNGSPYPNADVTVTVIGAGDTQITDGTFSFTYYDSHGNELPDSGAAPANAGSYSVVATWSGDANYPATSSNAAPFTINQATATVGLSGLTPTYDGSPLAATVATNPAGLNVSVTYNGSATAPTNAGSYAVVATVEDPNYAGTATGTLVIQQAGASVSLSRLTQTYNGSPLGASVTTNPAGLPVTVTYNGSATIPTNAGSYAVLATVTNPNYSGTATGTLVIEQASASVSLSSLSQTYTGLPLSASATTNPTGLALSITYNGSAAAPTNAGSYAVLATIENPNYAGSASGTLVIGKASLSVVVTNASRAYGAANPTFSSTVTGLFSGDGITESYSTTATASSSVGTYAIDVTLNDPNDRLGNYNVSITDGTLTVIKANLTIAANPQTKVFGSANPTLTGTITGLANGDNITATYSTTATTSSGVGSYPISVTVHDPSGKLSNYNLTVDSSTLTVTKAALTITADNESKVYGQAVPALALSYSGFVNGNTPAVLTSQPVASTTATASSNVGSYPITVSGAAAANYSISYVAGTLQVTPATLYVIVDPTISIKFIGQPDPNYTVEYVGFVLGQNSGVLGGTLTITTSLSTDSPIGIYLVTAGGLTSTNYNIVYVPGVALEL